MAGGGLYGSSVGLAYRDVYRSITAMGVRKCEEELSKPELGIEGMERFGLTIGAGTILSELIEGCG